MRCLSKIIARGFSSDLPSAFQPIQCVLPLVLSKKYLLFRMAVYHDFFGEKGLYCRYFNVLYRFYWRVKNQGYYYEN